MCGYLTMTTMMGWLWSLDRCYSMMDMFRCMDTLWFSDEHSLTHSHTDLFPWALDVSHRPSGWSGHTKKRKQKRFPNVIHRVMGTAGSEAMAISQ